MIRGIIQPLYRRVDGIGSLHYTIQKLRPPPTAFRPVVHFDLDQLGVHLLLLLHGRPLGFERIHHKVAGLIGTAKGDRQLAALFIDDPTRDILFLAPHIVITGLVIAAGESPP